MQPQNQPEGKIGEIRCWAICHSTEDEHKVESALRNVIGTDVTLEHNRTETHFGQPMLIISGRAKGGKKFSDIVNRISPEDIEAILGQLEERLDSDNTLHIRLDKQQAYGGVLKLSSDLDPPTRKRRDSIDIDIHITTYPSRRENAIRFIDSLLRKSDAAQG
jgi:RNA binding exosome subunit